ncbi:alpha/beta fold hydrolase [Nocardia sp. NPDC052278]|uniref:alpha/beta fold hydrolase n=1 Tax=unclassified Nocardia TaxID=2637762 RepID=UPI00368A37A6
MTNFVLTHGAWHGGWCWERVSQRLEAVGHTVHTPTLRGLGENVADRNPEIGLSTHVDDVAAVLAGLTDVVLVGHSYAGFVVREAADRLPDRVARLVMLDAWVGNDGQSLHDRAPQWFSGAMRQAAAQQGDGWLIPAPPASLCGVTDPADAAWLESRLTDQPLKTFEEPTRLTGAVDDIPCRAVLCTPGNGVPFADWAAEFDWPATELASGHDAMVTAPAQLAALLMEAP